MAVPQRQLRGFPECLSGGGKGGGEGICASGWYYVSKSGKEGLRLKKALLIIIAIVACCFLLANADYLMEFVDTLATGALIPIVIACVLMLLRHLTQAMSYKTAFDAVGFQKTTLWQDIVLIFSLVFINTFCLFSGATGVVFIIDDLRRKGAAVGTATSGAILSQIGYFAAVFVISVIGFVTMAISGQMNILFITGGGLLALVLLGLSSLFMLGYFKPDALYWLFDKIESLVNKIIGVFKRSLPPAWGSANADSMIKSARILAHNPMGTVISVSWASLSAILNMLCLVAIGFAFGYTNVPVLVAAFALAAVSVILSPTPQGIGVVEAAIAAIITGAGGDLATATIIALVYRGIMFWLPFCIGALLLGQTNFFKDKNKKADPEQQCKDVAWVSGTFVGVTGLVNIGLNFVPELFAPYSAVIQFVNFGDIFFGPTLGLVGVLLLILAFGLVMRFRKAWGLTMVLLVLVAAVEFLFYATITVAAVMVALIVWLTWHRYAFDQPITQEAFMLSSRDKNSKAA